MNQNTCIIILGMHRSGTSLLTNLINKLGIYIGENDDIVHENEYNQTGYYENDKIARLNDKILEFYHSTWDKPINFFNNNLEGKNEKIFIEEIENIIKTFNNNNQLWMFKDPRTCLTFPFWQKAFQNTNTNYNIIISMRNPKDTIESLISRDKFQEDLARNIYINYLIILTRIIINNDICIIKYENVLTSPKTQIKKIIKFLNLINIKIDNQFDNIIRKDLQHHKSGSNYLSDSFIDKNELVISFLSLLSNLSIEENENLQKIYQKMISNSTNIYNDSSAIRIILELQNEIELQRIKSKEKNKNLGLEITKLLEENNLQKDIISHYHNIRKEAIFKYYNLFHELNLDKEFNELYLLDKIIELKEQILNIQYTSNRRIVKFILKVYDSKIIKRNPLFKPFKNIIKRLL